MGGDAETPCTSEQLEVDSSSWPKRARPFDERASGAQVDERHGIARSKDRLSPGDSRLAESRVGPTIN
jgi:hypothetical protein